MNSSTGPSKLVRVGHDERCRSSPWTSMRGAVVATPSKLIDERRQRAGLVLEDAGDVGVDARPGCALPAAGPRPDDARVAPGVAARR